MDPTAAAEAPEAPPLDPAPPRAVLAVTGPDRVAFLQDLLTNDVTGLDAGPAYAALLTPQGKYLADFIVSEEGEAVRLDLAAPLAEGIARRLAMYRLRRKVEIAPTDLKVALGEEGMPDPRHPALPRRRYGTHETPGLDPALRVEHLIPEALIDLTPDTYVLEMGFERLGGVDFRKGCYVGQEIVARMKHKTTLRKGLARLALGGPAAPGDAITDAQGRAAGRVGTVADGRALAHLRFDREGLHVNGHPATRDA